jgi:UDP-GlcNAc:undecaprenyl-phosphate/decaprenyl-phosphate GlcNAc-1-phosphate transferase
MLHYILSFSVPFITLLIVIPIIIKIANRTGYIAIPSAERWHSKPTALLGGVGLFIGIIIGMIFSGALPNTSWGLITGIIIIFITGLYDDVFELSPLIKFIIEIGVGILVISSGILMGKGFIPAYIAVPLTLFWIVGITNALNLLDNMDGLSSGVSGIIAIFLGGIFLLNGLQNQAHLALILAGSSMGFLYYNFYPARIFMGDSGSLLLGFSLSVLSLMGSYQLKSQMILSLAIPLIVMVLPIFDTTLVTLNRKIVDRPISQGGKDHSSHRLIALGYNEKQSVLILYVITALGGSMALAMNFLNLPFALMTILALVIAFIGSGAFLSRIKVYTKNEYESISKNVTTPKEITLIKTALFYKRQIVEILLDTIFILFSLYFALWFQSANGVIDNELHTYRPLLFFAIYSLFVFYIFGFYKTIWRYISVNDLMNYCVAIFIVTLSLILYKLLLGLDELNILTCVVFGVILNYLVLGLRLSERMLSSIVKRSADPKLISTTNVLVVGAGSTGNIYVKEISQHLGPQINPIGFIDDDPRKAGSKIFGIPILGKLSDLESILKKNRIDEIIITISDIDMVRLSQMRALGTKFDVNVKRVEILMNNI